MIRFVPAMVVVALAWAPPAGAQSLTCRPADNRLSTLVDNVKQILTSADSNMVALRNSLGLSAVSASQVSQVTSGPACSKLMGAMNQLAGTPSANRSGYVVKVGNKGYFVVDPGATAGEHTPAYVFDNKYKFLRALLGP